MSNDINNPQKNLHECNEKSPLQFTPNLDNPPPYCNKPDEPNLRNVNGPDFDWLRDTTNQKTGLGASALCDPMQTGSIINDPANPRREVLYRYSKSLRGTDEAVRDLFADIVVIDEDGKAHPVPIIWATQEKAVAAVLLDNVRKDETLVVDRIRLPMLAVSSTGLEYDMNRYTYHQALDYMRYLRPDAKPGATYQEKYQRDTVFGKARGVPVNVSYTLYAWTLYLEDMNQIVEQILTKFSPVAYIRVRGVSWEVVARLDSIANNIDVEPGDQAIRVIKFQFNITAESYIPQPIARKKAVLKTKIDFVDGMTEEEITQVMMRLEEAVKELEC